MTRQLPLLLIVVCLAGCGRASDDERVEVGGEVWREGVSNTVNGAITLVPADCLEGPAVTTAIVDGRYHLKPDRGPVPGRHRVIVSLNSGAQKLKRLKGKANASFGRPREFTFEVTVPAGGSTDLDFHID